MKDQMRFVLLCLVSAIFAFGVVACGDDDDDNDDTTPVDTTPDDTTPDDTTPDDTTPDDTTPDDTTPDDTTPVDTTPDDTTPDDTNVSTDVPAEITVTGVVTRSAALTGDGIGTICIGIVDGCPSMTNQSPKGLGDAGAVIKDADMSDADVAIEYSVIVTTADAVMGTKYFATAFLLEEGGECGSAGADVKISKGDLVTFAGMPGKACGNFDYDGTDAADVDINLNFNMPITM